LTFKPITKMATQLV